MFSLHQGRCPARSRFDLSSKKLHQEDVMRKSDRELGRLRSHLTPVEVEQLLEAAGKTENGVRDRTLVLLMLRHALRVGEALDLRWEIDIDCTAKTLFVRRLKSGRS